MSLKDIEYGSLASSGELNNNFRYLETLINSLADTITTKTADFGSNVANLNASVKEVLDYKKSFFQTGMIISTTAATVPEGFLLCDGSEVLVSEYPNLYAVIGTTFGSSDSTKFKLPNLSDKTLWGKGSSDLGTSLTSKLPNITGTLGTHWWWGGSANGALYRSYGGTNVPAGNGGSGSTLKFDASKSSNVYDSNVSIVQPPALVVNFVIKY